MTITSSEALATSTYISPALLSQATVFEFLRRGGLGRNVELVRSLGLGDDPLGVKDVHDARARGQLEAAQAELEKVDAGDSKADRWQLEQRVKHAENQLAVSGRTTG